MKYKKLIDSELRMIARKVPYNKAVIKCANIFQTISFALTKILMGVAGRKITIAGHKGLKFKVEIFEPTGADEKLPCLIYIHGGAFSYKAAVYHKKLACIYAMEANCRVYFPDYHLTPKYPYPAAYEDVLALYRWIMENADEFGIDAEKIGVAGDSAGASIAAHADCKTDSMKKFYDTPLWNARNNRRMWSYYCRDLKADDAYGASPMHSRLPQNIPDTYIETAEYDCLHDEGILYGKRLSRSGAKVEINETIGTIHGYDSAINTKIAMRNIEKRILFLRKGFGGR